MKQLSLVSEILPQQLKIKSWTLRVIPKMRLNSREWTMLNRFRTGYGRCNHLQCKWGLTAEQSCDCGTDVRTLEHMVLSMRYFLEELARLYSVAKLDLKG